MEILRKAKGVVDWNLLVVLGAATGSGLIFYAGMAWGWPFLIGITVGWLLRKWEQDLITQDESEAQH
jgi:hypothetical protein